jgi:hypothetical protein
MMLKLFYIKGNLMWLQTVVYGPVIIPSHNNNTIPGIIMGTGMKIMTSIAIWIAGIVDRPKKRAGRIIQFIYLSPFWSGFQY